MKATTDRQEFLSAWYDFLTQAHRLYTKLDIGQCKADGKSRAWFGRKKHQRKTDELLRYIHHARNAIDHGIADSASPGSKLGPPEDDRPVLDIFFTPDGRVETRLSPVRLHPIHSDPNSARLHSVVDKGDTYDPPTQHLGQQIVNPTPLIVAELGVAAIRDVYLEALQLGRPPPTKK